MDARRIPIPPPPPSEPMPAPGTQLWADWHLRHTYSPDDAALIEYARIVGSVPYRNRQRALMAYVDACHVKRWAGWQATLAWSIIEATLAPLDMDDDIPF